MNKIFLSRENTSKLYKNILEENSLQALPRKSKELVVSMLVNNMKEVYKHINTEKVNKSNFKHIFGQFNSMCIKETSNNLKNSKVFNGEDSHVSRVKFARDFNSTPNKKVQFMERPKHMTQVGRNQKSTSSLDKMAMQSSSTLDNMFQPITNSTYDSGMNMDSDIDINKKMENINKMRQIEESRSNRRPSTPDFLKPQKTQQNSNSNSNSNSNYESQQNYSQAQQNYTQSGGDDSLNFKPNMNNNDTMAFNNFSNNNTNELSSYNDTGGGFTSIDEMNKPLIQTEIVEDNSSFEDRLKKLQSDRENFGTNDSTNNNTNNNSNSNNRSHELDQRQVYDLEQKKAYDLEQKKASDLEQKKAYELEQRRMYELEQKKASELEQKKAYELEQRQENINNISQNNMMNKLLERLNSIEQNRSTEPNSDKINSLIEENNKLKKEVDNLNELKVRISNEFDELRKKNETVQSNLQRMNQRELELNTRESDVTTLTNDFNKKIPPLLKK